VPAKPKLIFINQVTGYLFIDVINAFADEYECELYAGQLDPANTPLKSSVKFKSFIRYNRNVAYKRITTWAIFTSQVFFTLLFKKGKFELFIVSNPPFTPFVGYGLNKLRKIKYHLLVYDVYPDALVNFGMIKKGSTFEKIWAKRNERLYANASTIYTLSDGMATLIKQYNSGIKVEVIPNWADTSFIKPLKKTENPFAKEHGQLGKITIVYSGNMGAMHAVEKIAELAAQAKNDPDFGFLLIGDGSKKVLIENMKEELALDNLIILPYQSSEILPYSLACADIGIVTLSSGAEDLSVPSKTYNLLAAGVALLVIASPNSELAKLVDKYNCGVHFQEHELSKMWAFLNEMKADSEKLQSMKINARKASYLYTPENANKYKTVLNSNIHVS